MNGPLKYLAYGSNLHPMRLEDRGIEVEFIESIQLRGWRLAFHKKSRIDGSAKCNIMQSMEEHSMVWAALFAIERDHLLALDKYEGAGSGYNRETIELERHGEAFTYIASPAAISTTLAPYDWYRDMVVAGARFHSFPDDYVSEIEAIHAPEDPDPERAQKNRAILSKLRREY